MKKTPTPSMPSATTLRRSRLSTPPSPACRRSTRIGGRLIHCQAKAMSATGTRQKNAPRQPMAEPRYAPSGAATTVASALPPLKTASARGTWAGGTSRMAVAADMDQNPPTTTPISARPAM